MVVILAGPGAQHCGSGRTERVRGCVRTLQEGAARLDHGVGGKDDDASPRAGRNYERWLLCMTGAGTRGRWWWPQGRVIAGGIPCYWAALGPTCGE